MASNAFKECGVCNEEFDEDYRRPRSLPCCHSLCTDCIDELIARNKKVCPFCRRGFEVRSARDIGVNTGLLEALKFIREMEKKSSAIRTSSADTSNWREEFKKENERFANENVATCKEAQKQIDTDIKRNNEIINCLLQENMIIKNEILVKVHGIVNTNEERVRYLQEQNKRLQSQKKLLNLKQKQTEDAIKKLAETNTSKGTSTVFDEVENTNSDVQKLMERFEKIISGVEKTQNQIDKNTENMKDKVQILKEVSNSILDEDEHINLIQDLSLLTLDERAQVTIEAFLSRTKPIMELLRQGRIFALQDLEGKQRCARISVSEEDRICLHYLKEETLQPDALTLKQSQVMTLVDSSSRLAFLELSNERKEKLGRMYIRLSPQTKRANQFSLMCTGELGPTYANTKSLGVYCKDSEYECIWIGDYENQDGTGGKALVPGVCEKDDLCERSRLAGTVNGSFPVSGEERATQFFIITRTRFGEQLSYSFGIVEEGLQHMTTAIKNHPNINDVVISDCGLVLEI